MTTAARVIGLGQRLAGDDGVGIEVAERVRAMDLPGVEVRFATDASQVIEALVTPGPVVIVDAVLDAAPGRVRAISAEDLGPDRAATVSSHGIDLAAAIALARALYPDTVSPSIHVLGVGISRATRACEGLSPEVAAAVPRAAAAAIALARDT